MLVIVSLPADVSPPRAKRTFGSKVLCCLSVSRAKLHHASWISGRERCKDAHSFIHPAFVPIGEAQALALVTFLLLRDRETATRLRHIASGFQPCVPFLDFRPAFRGPVHSSRALGVEVIPNVPIDVPLRENCTWLRVMSVPVMFARRDSEAGRRLSSCVRGTS